MDMDIATFRQMIITKMDEHFRIMNEKKNEQSRMIKEQSRKLHAKLNETDAKLDELCSVGRKPYDSRINWIKKRQLGMNHYKIILEL